MRWMFVMIGLMLAAWPIRADWGIPQNLGPGVNTPGYDFSSSLTVSGDTLYFVRIEADGIDYNLYVSVFKSGAWDSAVALSDSINTASNGEVDPFISYDGGRLYFTRFPLSNHDIFHIFYSEKRSGVWQGPKRFEAMFNNDSSNVAWPCFTHDGKRLYFYSFNRPGGVGLGDLWYSDYDSLTQIWGLPVNLGDSINTPDWEFCPTLSWDDQTLYFHSARSPFFNAKIYKSVIVNGIWQGCTMLPEPINYPGGRSHYPCLSADGQHLFFTGADLPLPSYGLFDIYMSTWVEGVEEGKGGVKGMPVEVPLKAIPNPFVSFCAVPGHASELFSIYDVSGRKVGYYKGDRIGVDLSAGIYFLKLNANNAKPLRILKLR